MGQIHGHALQIPVQPQLLQGALDLSDTFGQIAGQVTDRIRIQLQIQQPGLFPDQPQP